MPRMPLSGVRISWLMAFGVFQLLLELLALGHVLSGDDDPANVTLGIAPGINSGSYPLLDTISTNPDFFAQMLPLVGQAPTVRFAPFFREVRNEVVKEKPGEIGVAEAGQDEHLGCREAPGNSERRGSIGEGRFRYNATGSDLHIPGQVDA